MPTGFSVDYLVDCMDFSRGSAVIDVGHSGDARSKSRQVQYQTFLPIADDDKLSLHEKERLMWNTTFMLLFSFSF